MPTLTIDLSDVACTAAMQLPEEYRRRIIATAADDFVVAAKSLAAKQAVPQYEGQNAEEHLPPTQEDLDAIGRGLADEVAGRYEDGFEMIARLREARRNGTGAFAGRGKRD